MGFHPLSLACLIVVLLVTIVFSTDQRADLDVVGGYNSTLIMGGRIPPLPVVKPTHFVHFNISRDINWSKDSSHLHGDSNKTILPREEAFLSTFNGTNTSGVCDVNDVFNLDQRVVILDVYKGSKVSNDTAAAPVVGRAERPLTSNGTNASHEDNDLNVDNISQRALIPGMDRWVNKTRQIPSRGLPILPSAQNEKRNFATITRNITASKTNQEIKTTAPSTMPKFTTLHTTNKAQTTTKYHSKAAHHHHKKPSPARAIQCGVRSCGHLVPFIRKPIVATAFVHRFKCQYMCNANPYCLSWQWEMGNNAIPGGCYLFDFPVPDQIKPYGSWCPEKMLRYDRACPEVKRNMGTWLEGPQVGKPCDARKPRCYAPEDRID
ncbi:MAG: hypothetical protein M1814_005291 [Vezdaea aestivalis]|nr:MAG: hypothetical protein M1814_005291 [Vezdaea aestivalis]